MTLETYWIYLAVVAVFFATPPDTSQLLTISNSIRYGLRKSLFTVAGDLSANCVQMTCAAFGLAAIVATSAQAFVWIKWLGVAYLLWIGVQMILARGAHGAVDPAATGTKFRLFRQGFITSMANPFAVVFFAALFPQFIDPNDPILPQLLILGATYIVVDGSILIAWGWLGTRAARLLGRAPIPLINRICGGLMILAALLLASKDLAPEPSES